jgi:hypothetical protein
MKIIIVTLLMNGLLGIGLLTPSPETSKQPSPEFTIATVLQAHHVPADPKVLSSYICEAVKLISTDISTSPGASNYFERKVLVSRNGDLVKRQKSDPLGLREQFELSDGKANYHTTFEKGLRVEEVTQMEATKVQDFDFAINTFGLLPILRQLADSRTEIIYIGRTARQFDQFKVKTSHGSWTLFCDQKHLIRRLHMKDMVIDYADYRTVGGLQLPFIQRQSVGNRLLYELVFTRIEVNPGFAPESFARETL